MDRLRELFWIVNSLIVFTLLVWITDLDHSLATLLYTPGPLHYTSWQLWSGQTNPFWMGIYRLTPWPAALLGISALAALLLGLRRARFRAWRRQALFVLLLLALGPWLLVNVLLKDTLGKPRPSQLLEFNGTYRHTQFWEPGTGSDNGSFPSGHAAIAFSVMAPWFFLRGRRGRLGAGFLAAGIGWGLLVGTARMAQGGHFFSDVIWSGGIIYLLGLILASALALDRESTVVSKSSSLLPDVPPQSSSCTSSIDA